MGANFEAPVTSEDNYNCTLHSRFLDRAPCNVENIIAIVIVHILPYHYIHYKRGAAVVLVCAGVP